MAMSSATPSAENAKAIGVSYQALLQHFLLFFTLSQVFEYITRVVLETVNFFTKSSILCCNSFQ